MAHRTRPTDLTRDSRLIRRRLRADADATARGSRSQRRRTAAEKSMLLAR